MLNHAVAGSIDGRVWFLRLGIVPVFVNRNRVGTGELAPAQEGSRQGRENFRGARCDVKRNY